MHVDSDAARSRGDLPAELREIKRRLDVLENARSLESSSIGSGGLRMHDGGGLRVHQGGDVLVEDEGDVTVAGGGDIQVLGGRLVARDGDGEDVFVVTTDPPAIFLRQALITEVSRQIIAATVHSDTVEANENLSEASGQDTGYVDLDTTGPSVTFDTITGRWIVLLFAHGTAVGEGATGRVSYAATGAQSLSAIDARSSLLTAAEQGGIWTWSGVHMLTKPHTGAPGQITVTAKYKLTTTVASGSASFRGRTMIVIAY